jgi:vacuolar-type H+-ATPase subunit H
VSENRDHGSNYLRDLTDAASRNPLSAALIGMGALWFLGDKAWQGAGRPTIDQASDVVGSAISRIRKPDADGQWGLTELFRQQPLALGVVGLAIGAGLAATLPSTFMETQLMGESSDELKAKAREFANDQADRAENAAERALGAATEEAQKQGLTREGLKSAKDSAGAKLERVVEAANQGISDRNGRTK